MAFLDCQLLFYYFISFLSAFYVLSYDFGFPQNCLEREEAEKGQEAKQQDRQKLTIKRSLNVPQANDTYSG